MKAALLLLALIMIVAPNTASAVAVDETVLEDASQEARARALMKGLRCLVCQNQPISDSSAPLAADLRREIKRMIQEGQSEAQIKDFLVERYGDYVLYKPRFRSWNLVLWTAPVFLLLIGGIALSRIVRRRTDLPIDEDAP